MEKRLEQKTAIVFGATGSAGHAICERLAAEGAKVIVHYNSNHTKAEEIVATIKAAGGEASAMGACCDDLAAVEDLAKATYDKYGSIDLVVNLVYRDKGWRSVPVTDLDWADWDLHFEAIHAHFNICKVAVRYMREHRFGRIVFISGGLAYRFYEGCAPFSCTKAGLNAFTKTLAKEEGKNNITANVVAPGMIVSREAAQAKQDRDARFDCETICDCPLGKHASVDDVANAVLFFLSPDGDGVTGQTLYVSGGEIMPMP